MSKPNVPAPMELPSGGIQEVSAVEARLILVLNARARAPPPRPRDLRVLAGSRTDEVEQRTGKYMTSNREAAVVTRAPDV